MILLYNVSSYMYIVCNMIHFNTLNHIAFPVGCITSQVFQSMQHLDPVRNPESREHTAGLRCEPWCKLRIRALHRFLWAPYLTPSLGTQCQPERCGRDESPCCCKMRLDGIAALFLGHWQHPCSFRTFQRRIGRPV